MCVWKENAQYEKRIFNENWIISNRNESEAENLNAHLYTHHRSHMEQQVFVVVHTSKAGIFKCMQLNAMQCNVMQCSYALMEN